MISRAVIHIVFIGRRQDDNSTLKPPEDSLGDEGAPSAFACHEIPSGSGGCVFSSEGFPTRDPSHDPSSYHLAFREGCSGLAGGAVAHRSEASVFGMYLRNGCQRPPRLGAKILDCWFSAHPSFSAIRGTRTFVLSEGNP